MIIFQKTKINKLSNSIRNNIKLNFRIIIYVILKKVISHIFSKYKEESFIYRKLFSTYFILGTLSNIFLNNYQNYFLKY